MNPSIKLKSSALLLASLALFQTVNAADEVLVAYDFGTTGSETFAATTVASGVSGSDITNASLSAFELGDYGTGYATAPVLKASPINGSATLANAVTNDAYFSFTITPDALQSIDLTSLTFDAAAGGTSGGDRGYGVFSSVDDYTSDLGFAVLSTVRPDWTSVTIDLSGVAFDNITTATTFRIYTYSDAAARSVEYDNIAVNGSVIPEPGTYALFVGLTGLSFLMLRRRR